MINDFINGAVMMACVVTGLFFLRFWKGTYDRLFLMFAVAFWLLAAYRVVIEAIGQSTTSSPAAYGLRLAAFIVIIAAIADKNRKR